MSYVVHNFQPGDVIRSYDINAMDTQIVELGTQIGDLTALTTTDKDNLVDAINELKTDIGATVQIDDTTTSTASVWSSQKIEFTTGMLSSLTTTAKNNLVAAINEVMAKASKADGVGTLTDLTTVDKTNLVAAVNEIVGNIGDLSTLTTDEKDSIVEAINDVMSKIGDLDDLTTEDKDSIVEALNEVDAHADNTAKAIAGAFIDTANYPAGSFVTKDGKLYTNANAVTPGAWDAAKWTEVTVADKFLTKLNPVIENSVSMGRVSGTSTGANSVALGLSVTASGLHATALGKNTVASGQDAFASGLGTIAAGARQSAIGRYNIKDTSEAYALIIGNGNSDSARSNAAAIKWNGDAIFAGDVYADGEKLAVESIIADAYETKAYTKDDYVIKDGKLYKAKKNTAAAWNPAEWEETDLVGAMKATTEVHAESIAPAYAEASSYLAGSKVMYGGDLYLCTNATTGAFKPADWQKINIGDAYLTIVNPKATGTAQFGQNTSATGTNAFAAGRQTVASGVNSTAFGITTEASDDASFAIGTNTHATGESTFAAGDGAVASAVNASAIGLGVVAKQNNQHVIGKFNYDSPMKYQYIIGIGADDDNRVNGLALDENGNLKIKGKLYVECDDDSENGTEGGGSGTASIDDSTIATDKVWSSSKVSGQIGTLGSLTTTDKSNLVAAVNELKSKAGDTTALQTTDKSSVVGAVNELNTNIGDKSTLTTTAKTNLVGAINELDGDVGDKSTLTTASKTDLVSAINEVDGDVGDKSTLTTTAKTSVVAAVNELDGDIGNKASLTTTAKTNLVAAINEVDGDVGDKSTLTTTAKGTLVAAINEVDGDVGDKATLTTTEKTDLVSAINELDGEHGDLATLKTDAKDTFVEAINEVYEDAKDIKDAIAGEFNSTKAYLKGAYAWHDDALYVCTVAIPLPGEAWTASHWSQVTVGEEVRTTKRDLGTLTDLETSVKNSAVEAINEVKNQDITIDKLVATAGMTTIPSSLLPAFVSAIEEYSSITLFPTTGSASKIYIDTTTNKSYRWSGTQYVEISKSLSLGITAETAFRGDHGEVAYAHAFTNKGVALASNLYKVTTNAEGHVTAGQAIVAQDILDLAFDSLWPVGAIYTTAATTIPASFSGTWTEVKPQISGVTWATIGKDAQDLTIDYVAGTATGNTHYFKRTA